MAGGENLTAGSGSGSCSRGDGDGDGDALSTLETYCRSLTLLLTLPGLNQPGLNQPGLSGACGDSYTTSSVSMSSSVYAAVLGYVVRSLELLAECAFGSGGGCDGGSGGGAGGGGGGGGGLSVVVAVRCVRLMSEGLKLVLSLPQVLLPMC